MNVYFLYSKYGEKVDRKSLKSMTFGRTEHLSSIQASF